MGRGRFCPVLLRSLAGSRSGKNRTETPIHGQNGHKNAAEAWYIDTKRMDGGVREITSRVIADSGDQETALTETIHQSVCDADLRGDVVRRCV